MRRAIIVLACSIGLGAAFLACGESADPFAGTWHGVGDESSLNMRIERVDDSSYSMETSGGTVPLSLSNGSLVGTADLGGEELKVRISFSGTDTLHTEMTGTSGEWTGMKGTVEWLREGAATPAGFASMRSLSEDDREYMSKLSEGMALSVKSVNLTSAAWEQGMYTETGLSRSASGKLSKGWELVQEMAVEWSPFPQPPSPELEPLMRKVGRAMSHGAHYCVESHDMYDKMASGMVPSEKQADRMMVWYDKWQNAVKAVKAEYARLEVEQ